MTTTVTVETPAPGIYRMDPRRSKIRYTSKHMFGTGTVHATFDVEDGEIDVRDPMTGSGVTVTVDATSFASDSAKRDKDVRSARLLDVASYPDIAFTSKSVREDGKAWIVAGTVTAHGNSVPVDVLLDRLTVAGEDITVHGRAVRLDRYEFGVTGGRGFVGRYLDLEVDVTASRT